MSLIRATLYSVNAFLLISSMILFGMANIKHSKQLQAAAQALLGLWLFPGCVLLYMAMALPDEGTP